MDRRKVYYKKLKRKIDICFSLIGLLLLLPIYAIIIAAIKIDSKGSILFRQKRVGIRKKYFYIYKFRTMKAEAPKNVPTHLLVNPEQYITRVGRVLRKTSLDELPQLINVLQGDMSFVGPRPALWNQDDLVEERDKYHANDIKPGITGWAQINGRDEMEISAKAKLDGFYVRHMGFFMDLACLFGTVVCVLRQDGIAEGKQIKER